MWNDGVVIPQPPIQRAMKELVGALKEQDTFEVKDFTPYRHGEMDRLVVRTLSGDILSAVD